MARVARLRKQRKFLLAREKEMARRGLRHLEELDRLEEQERVESELIVRESLPDQGAPPTLPAGMSFDPDTFSGFGPETLFWSGSGFDGGTGVAEASSSVSVPPVSHVSSNSVCPFYRTLYCG